MRAGTENVILIAALGEASRLALVEERELLRHMLTMKKRLLDNIFSLLAAANAARGSDKLLYICNGPRLENTVDGLDKILLGLGMQHNPSCLLKQLPNTISISFRNLKVSGGIFGISS